MSLTLLHDDTALRFIFQFLHLQGFRSSGAKLHLVCIQWYHLPVCRRGGESGEGRREGERRGGETERGREEREGREGRRGRGKVEEGGEGTTVPYYSWSQVTSTLTVLCNSVSVSCTTRCQ